MRKLWFYMIPPCLAMSAWVPACSSQSAEPAPVEEKEEALSLLPPRHPGATFKLPPSSKPAPPLVDTGWRNAVPLTPTTIPQFIDWISKVPVGERERIRSAIALAEPKNEIANILHKELFGIPVMDLSRHITILSILGELEQESSVPWLRDFIWYKEALMLNEDAPEVPTNGGAHTTEFPRAGTQILQARATEMLTWITHRTHGSQNVLTEIIARHGSKAVRAAAIDSFMFNYGDNDSAKWSILKFVKEEDQLLVGLPRLVRGMTKEETDSFNHKLREFYSNHPDQKPPVPEERTH